MTGNSHNGVAILIHNSIQYKKINTFFDDSLQNVAFIIKVYNQQLSLISFYSPGQCTPIFEKRKFDSLLSDIPKPLIIAGDFNAFHTSWGCSRTNIRGRLITDSIDDNDLVLLNDGQPTTVGSHVFRPNGLDLTMVSSSLALSCSWQVYSDSLGSYHLPTVTKYSVFIG